MAKVAITAQERVDTALKSAEFLQNTWENSPQFNKLLKASENLGKIAGYYKKAEKAEKDYEALKQIYEAMKVLRDDQVIYQNPAAAAAAFDQLFMGFGSLAQKFPPPFDSTVGEFLYELGKSGFFGNMSRALNPMTRESGRGQWSQIEGFQ